MLENSKKINSLLRKIERQICLIFNSSEELYKLTEELPKPQQLELLIRLENVLTNISYLSNFHKKAIKILIKNFCNESRKD
jgi:hypothetical protein